MGNIFRSIFSKSLKNGVDQQQQSKITMLGLDGAGKTTILYSLKLGTVQNTVPTIGFNVEELHYEKVSFMVWDVGGQQKLRNLWSHYFEKTDGLIYVVDSSDSERIDLSASELRRIISHEHMQDCVVLVLANKRDVATMSLDGICQKLGLKELQNRNWAIFPITAINCEKAKNGGLAEAMQWLVTNMNHVKHYTKKVQVGNRLAKLN